MAIDIDNLEVAISEIMEEYGDVVFKATEKGIKAGEKVLINNLKAKSPKSKGLPDSGGYAKAWKGKRKKYKLKRYVGNTKTVKGKKGEIPLSNILEYSSNSKHKGLIKKTYNESVNDIARAIIDELKKEA